jgi:hypothetical protein
MAKAHAKTGYASERQTLLDPRFREDDGVAGITRNSKVLKVTRLGCFVGERLILDMGV